MCAVLIYIVSLIIAALAIITGAASGIASSIKNDAANINPLIYYEYCDTSGEIYEMCSSDNQRGGSF